MIKDKRSFLAGLRVGMMLGRRILVGIIAKFIRANGIYRASDEGADGYSVVTVEVPNTYTATDEGKVVQNGELAAQSSMSVTANGTYSTVANDEVTVNVPNTYEASDNGKVVENGTLVPQSSMYITLDGTYDTTVISEVTVLTGGGGKTVFNGRIAPDGQIGNDGDVYVRSFPIPTGLTPVEFLESSGTQYINTGIIANQGTDVKAKIAYKGNNFILGCRTGSATSASKMLVISGSSQGMYCLKSDSTARRPNAFVHSVTIGNVYTSEVKTILEGTTRTVLMFTIGADLEFYHTVNAFTADYPQILFGIQQGSAPTAGAAKIYRVTYYQDGIVLADYIPCLDANGIPCMLENVSGVCAYNDGTGDFSYGSAAAPEITPDMCYVKKNGSWVLTG